jgi:two-component system sensor histidine kinase UhpB
MGPRVAKNIIERRQAESHLRLVIDTIPAMAWSLRPDGAVDFVNQRWLDYTGLSLDEALEDSKRIVHPEDLPRAVEKWLPNMAAGIPGEDEMRLRRANGEYRWFLIRTVPLRDARGNIVKWFGTSTDIEDRKQAEDALRQSEFELAEAQRVARIGSWTMDIATNIIQGSDEFYRIFEVEKTASASAYEALSSKVHPDDLGRFSQIAAEIRSSGGPYELEYRIKTRSGQEKHIRAVGYTKKDAAGAIAGLFGTTQDITERKHAENALRDSGVQLQALSRRLVDLQESERKELARELHDRVGQSLTALKINIDILQAALAAQGNDEVLARVADSAALLESTMDTIENVMSELRPPMLDHHGLAAALDWHARNFSRRTGIAVEVRARDPAVRPAPQIEIALFRIAQEALNNVAKHAGARRAEIVLSHANGECVMSVQDDGIGFDGVEEGSGKPKVGFGMVTMRERSQAVGGRFEVRALPGRGTQLTVRVPY